LADQHGPPLPVLQKFLKAIFPYVLFFFVLP